MGRLAFPIVLLVLVSGCASGGADPASLEDPAPHAPPEVLVSDDDGAVRGLVVDAAIAPVGNATVELLELSLKGSSLRSVQTDEAGAFVMARIPMGSYRLEARAPAFSTTGRIVDVRPGEVLEVQLVLSDVATDQPYLAIRHRAGLINCGFAVIFWAPFCGGDTLSAAFGRNNAMLNFTIPVGHVAVISETDWGTRDQTMHQWFYADNRQTKWLGDAMSAPVLRKAFSPDVKASSMRTIVGGTHVPFPSSSTEFTMEVWSFYDGSHQETFNRTLGPACAYSLVGHCAGVGVAIQFRFNQYVSIFVREAPADLAKYSAVPDG